DLGQQLLDLLVLLQAVVDQAALLRVGLAHHRVEDLLLDGGVHRQALDDLVGGVGGDAFVVGGRLVLTEELLDLAVVAGEQLDRIGPRAGHRRRLCRHRYISLLFLGFASIGIASPTPSDATGSDVPPAPPLDPGPGGSPAARRWTMRPNSPAWTGTRRYQ